jgi:uroporphyrin-3 C-methyltransferase
MSTDSEDDKDRKGLRPWLLPEDGKERSAGDQPSETAAGTDAETASPASDPARASGSAEAGSTTSGPTDADTRDTQPQRARSETGSKTEPKGEVKSGKSTAGAAKAGTAESPAKRPGRVLGSLSLLLALAALACAGYLYYLLIYLNPEADTVAQIGAEMATQEQRVAALDSRLSTLSAQQQDALSALQQSQEAALAASEAALLTALNDVSRQGPPSAREWQLAEAQYLLRIANHRLLMERDVPSALRLLKAADQILMELDDFSLHTVRARLADEILALGNVEGVDVQGLFLRLEALKGELDQLPLRLPEYLVDDQAQPDPQKGFWAVLGDEFSNYLQLRRFDGSVKPLLAPEEAVYLELNLRLMLERAQLAALRREQLIYQESLTTAQEWIEAYLDLEERPVRRMIDELSSLSDLTLDRPLPDISGSLNELASVLRSPS